LATANIGWCCATPARTGVDIYATTLVSAAMQAVVDAATVAEARTAMGIDDAISAAVAIETSRAEAAEGVLQSNINTTNTNLANAESALSAAITAEAGRAEAAEAALSSQISADSGVYGDTYTLNTQYRPSQ
jgi:hypothetical protein